MKLIFHFITSFFKNNIITKKVKLITLFLNNYLVKNQFF